jgi:hypothetical protein
MSQRPLCLRNYHTVLQKAVSVPGGYSQHDYKATFKQYGRLCGICVGYHEGQLQDTCDRREMSEHGILSGGTDASLAANAQTTHDSGPYLGSNFPALPVTPTIFCVSSEEAEMALSLSSECKAYR